MRENDGRYLLSSYSQYDSLRVTPAVRELIEEFDGTRTFDTIAAAARGAGRPVPSRSLILALYRLRILEDAGPIASLCNAPVICSGRNTS